MTNYVIFAGVNWVGKSTLHNTITPALDLGVKINTDEWKKDIKKIKKDLLQQMFVQIRRKYFNKLGGKLWEVWQEKD